MGVKTTNRNHEAPPSAPPAAAREAPGLRRFKVAITRLLIVLAVLVTVRYFWWRALHTLNPAAKWFFYLFLGAELLNFLEAALFYITTWKPTHHASPPALLGRSVDVFIATYNEPLSILRDTVVCAVSMHYPHKTYILDDGNRPEVRELARQFGCGYIGRSQRTHAKAGNLNNALQLTDSEFIVTLDADHVPTPELIDQLIGFFADPQVAIVQTSQDFYNMDSFQHVTDWRTWFGWQQQELFFGVIQPGKDGYDAAFYCGSPAMLRRKALAEVGGFATETITEDMHTGLRLQKKGWRVLYCNRTLARGLAPQTFTGFATQWLRWGHGAMQVLRRERPVFGKGLSFGQRVCYFASFYFYWMSYQKLIYILTPIFCLLSGIYPLVSEPALFVLYFGPYFLLNILATSVLQRGLRSFLLSEQFNLMKMHVLMKTIVGLFRSDSKFTVTPKSRSGAPRWTEMWPQMAILMALVVALIVGGLKLGRAEPGYQFWALVVNLFWAFFYLLLTAPVVWRALVRKELRGNYRFPSRLDVPVRFDSVASNGGPVSGLAYARNLNRFGFSITRESAIPVETLLEIELTVPGRAVRALGKVMWNEEYKFEGRKRVANGIRFEHIDPLDQDEISKYLFWEVAPRHGSLLRLTQATQTEEPNA